MAKYYPTRAEAEKRRRKGDRIYHKKGKGYYIVRPRKSFWEKLWE
jgi:hypothetical protein